MNVKSGKKFGNYKSRIKNDSDDKGFIQRLNGGVMMMIVMVFHDGLVFDKFRIATPSRCVYSYKIRAFWELFDRDGMLILKSIINFLYEHLSQGIKDLNRLKFNRTIC